MTSIRIATWNTKQGVAPLQKEDRLWEWIIRNAEPDVLVLTEARVSEAGIPREWQAVYAPGGIGHRRRYGTIIAARGAEISPVDFTRTQDVSCYPHPATTFGVEIRVRGCLELVLLGAYGLLSDEGDGYDELGRIAEEYIDLIAEYGDDRTVIAGDFNLLPCDLLPVMSELGVIDVTGEREHLPRLRDARGGSRIWTHKNGGKNKNGACQELDFIFVSADLVGGLGDIMGGVDDFPDAWEMSDHAPVAATIHV